MKKKKLLVLFLAVAVHAAAQQSSSDKGQYPPPVTFTAEQDHDDMMKQLGIKTLRPGPSGDDKAPNHANYDTALANPYPDLPDVLTLKNGKKVNTPAAWWHERRPEIVEDFEREVYGRIPAGVPRVTWTTKVMEREFSGFTPVIAKQLTGHVDNSAYPLIDVNINMTLVLPANAKGPVPVLMMFARSALPAPVQPPAEDLDKINAALRQLLVKDHPELQPIFDRYPAYSLITNQPPAGFGPPRNAGDPPTAQQLIADGWDTF